MGNTALTIRNIRRVFLLFAIAAMSLVCLELLLESYIAFRSKDNNAQISPYYPYSFNTLSGGERIGQSGYLQLALHPFVGYFNLPNRKTAYYSINSRGYRGSEIKVEKKQGDYRIIVVGGSTAFGTGLMSDDQTYAVQLQKMLPHADVINAAVIGHLSGQELVYIVTELINLKPDLVITLDGYNDVADQLQGEPRKIQTLGVNNTFFLIEKRLRKLYLLESGPLNLKAIRVLNLFFPAIFSKTEIIFKKIQKIHFIRSFVNKFHPVVPNGSTISLSEIEKTYVDNTIKMNKILNAYGVRFISVKQPHRDFFSRELSDSVSNQYLQFVVDVTSRLDEENVYQLNLNSTGSFKKEMFMDSVHLNPEGNKAMAQLTADFIQDNHIFSNLSLGVE